MTDPCLLCEAPAGARWQGKPVCLACVPAIMRAHLAKTGRLRLRWADDGKALTTEDGRALFGVERYWGWRQPSGRHAWATIYQATVRDLDTGGLYWGRGSGPGHPIIIRPKAIPKRLRELLAKNGVES